MARGRGRGRRRRGSSSRPNPVLRQLNRAGNDIHHSNSFGRETRSQRRALQNLLQQNRNDGDVVVQQHNEHEHQGQPPPGNQVEAPIHLQDQGQPQPVDRVEAPVQLQGQGQPQPVGRVEAPVQLQGQGLPQPVVLADRLLQGNLLANVVPANQNNSQACINNSVNHVNHNNMPAAGVNNMVNHGMQIMPPNVNNNVNPASQFNIAANASPVLGRNNMTANASINNNNVQNNMASTSTTGVNNVNNMVNHGMQIMPANVNNVNPASQFNIAANGNPVLGLNNMTANASINNSNVQNNMASTSTTGVNNVDMNSVNINSLLMNQNNVNTSVGTGTNLSGNSSMVRGINADSISNTAGSIANIRSTNSTNTGQSGLNLGTNLMLGSVSSNVVAGGANTIGMGNSVPMSDEVVQHQIGFNPLMSVCAPIGTSVPKNLRQKIVNGEYVDFATLLEKSDPSKQQEEKEHGMALSVSQGGKLVWKSNKPKGRITSINTWTSAFLIFSSIYLEVHPLRAQQLITYAHLIRTIAARFPGYGWRSYDQQWRMRQQSQPQRSWSLIDGELWSVYVTSSNVGPFNTWGSGFRQQYVTRGSKNTNTAASSGGSGSRAAGSGKVCFSFNRQQSCSRKNCMYIHKCSKCNAVGHGAAKCNKGN